MFPMLHPMLTQMRKLALKFQNQLNFKFQIFPIYYSVRRSLDSKLESGSTAAAASVFSLMFQMMESSECQSKKGLKAGCTDFGSARGRVSSDSSVKQSETEMGLVSEQMNGSDQQLGNYYLQVNGFDSSMRHYEKMTRAKRGQRRRLFV
jgi:hypothetical protein